MGKNINSALIMDIKQMLRYILSVPFFILGLLFVFHFPRFIVFYLLKNDKFGFEDEENSEDKSNRIDKIMKSLP